MIFINRIVAFNTTFPPLGGCQKGGKTFGMIWYEAVFGQNDEDITSTYVKFVKEYKRD